MMAVRIVALWLGVLAACRPEPAAPAPDDSSTLEAARRIASRLSYIAADYPLTVSGGEIVDDEEYDEQLELLEDLVPLLAALPEGEPKSELARRVAALTASIRERAPGSEVARAATESADLALASHRLILAPLGTPDRDRARALFAENCVKCHGPRGAGDGPQAAELAIKPRSLTDPAVMEEMSPARVWNTLTDGIAEAEMPQFDLLAARDRWSLASFVMTLRFGGPEGELAGELPPGAAPPSRFELAASTDRELRDRLGASGLARARTELAFAPASGPLAPAHRALASAIEAHGEGKRREASGHLDAAIAEVFAPLRAGLAARDRRGAWRLEAELYQLRAELPEAASAGLRQRALHAARELEAGAAELGAVSPYALAAIAALASLGWIVVLLLTGALAARSAGVPRAGRAIHIGWVLGAAAGAGTLLASGGEVDLGVASQRHQLVALLQFGGAAAALAVAAALLRRLAVAAPRPALDPSRTPWWLATAAFAVSYGGATETAHHLGQIAQSTGASRPLLIAAAALAAGGLAAVLRLAAEAHRRVGAAPVLAVSAVLAIACAVALAGHGAHALLDGGTLSASAALGVRFDPVGLYPYRVTGAAQLFAAGLAAAAAIIALEARRRAA